jgi:hypothetical protein
MYICLAILNIKKAKLTKFRQGKKKLHPTSSFDLFFRGPYF